MFDAIRKGRDNANLFPICIVFLREYILRINWHLSFQKSVPPAVFSHSQSGPVQKTVIRTSTGGPVAGSVVTKIDRCMNYNNAARGWNPSSDVYKPVTFSGTQPIRKTVTTHTPQFAAMSGAPYTDF